MSGFYKYFLITYLFLAWFSTESQAQESLSQDSLNYKNYPSSSGSLFTDNYHINPNNEGRLDLSIDNLSFFKNNESDGDVFDGYSLPGFRIQPRVIYYPASFVKLEAGVSLLRFWGADKYPCYTYQNIAEWKADDYQYGFHILPFFRAQIQPISQISLVLGSLYGGSNHGIIEPLFNPELNLTADPESGAQFLYRSGLARADIWINWESFTFKNDTHNEAFTVGTSAALNITPESSFFNLSLPIQLLAVHRGGEIDTMQQNITTMINATTGLQFKFNTNRLLKNISLQLMVAGYDGDGGSDLLYTRGWAFYSNLTASIWNIKLKAAYWRSSDFINIFGNPVFENVSLTLPDRIFPTIDVLSTGFSYEQEFGNGFFMGADFDLYYNPRLAGYDPVSYGSSTPSKISKSINSSFGIYLRINPSIILKRKKIN